jgi:tetratricopeptide (TPR) repeat protein
MAAGDFKKAEAAFAEIKRNAPGIPLGYVKTGTLYIRQGKMERAVPEYERAAQLNPKSWLILNDLAVLLGETARSGKDLDHALAVAEKSSALNPGGMNVKDTLGWLYYRKGDAAKAVDLLRQVQAKSPDAVIINYHLGMALYRAGKMSEAKECLNRALAKKIDFRGKDEATKTLAGL